MPRLSGRTPPSGLKRSCTLALVVRLLPAMPAKRKFDTRAAQSLLAAQQPLSDVRLVHQRTRERLQQAVASLDAACKPKQRAQRMAQVADVLRHVLLDNEATSTYLDSLSAHVVPEAAVALGGCLQARVQRHLNPSSSSPLPASEARERILEAAHEAAHGQATTTTSSKKKQKNKKKKTSSCVPATSLTTISLSN